jgi:hypothetical protein
MGDFIKDFVVRLASRKFLAGVACFAIVLLDGLDVAEFSAEVLAIASAGLLTYIGTQGVIDYKSS